MRTFLEFIDLSHVWWYNVYRGCIERFFSYMNKDERKKNELVISEALRGRYLVSQKNNLAKSFGKLNTFEHRLLDYCISFIRNKDDSQTTYRTTMKNILDYFELEPAGKNYIRATNALKRLLEGTTLSLPRFDKNKLIGIELVNLFEKVYFGLDGAIEFTFSSDLKADLFDLKKDFYAFRLEELSKIKSKYALVLLKLWGAKRYKNQYKTILIGSVEEWQSWLLGDDRRLEPAIFKRDCLQKAVNELNKQEDMNISVEVLKKGRKVTGYEVVILSNRNVHGEVIEAEIVEVPKIEQKAQVEAPVSPLVSMDHFFKSLQSLTKINKQQKEQIALLAETFDEEERVQVLSFAKELFIAHQAEKAGYLIKTLEKWKENNIKTLKEAKEFYELNSSSKTPQQPQETNIPGWSDMHPDNENKQKAKATQEDLDKLIEIQNTLGVFDTPKSIAEREKMQNEINEASEVDNNK